MGPIPTWVLGHAHFDFNAINSKQRGPVKTFYKSFQNKYFQLKWTNFDEFSFTLLYIVALGIYVTGD